MKTFDEWFKGTYGCSFNKKAGPMTPHDGLHLLADSVGLYVTYAAQFVDKAREHEASQELITKSNITTVVSSGLNG